MTVDDLPLSLQPERDLWSGIEERLDQEPPRQWTPLVAAAAALLLALGGQALAPEPLSPETPVVAAAPDWEQDLRTSAEALEAELDARRGELDPSSVATIEENLALIDDAIEECRAALDAGDSEQADQALIAAWNMKIATLKAVL